MDKDKLLIVLITIKRGIYCKATREYIDSLIQQLKTQNKEITT